MKLTLSFFRQKLIYTAANLALAEMLYDTGIEPDMSGVVSLRIEEILLDLTGCIDADI